MSDRFKDQFDEPSRIVERYTRHDRGYRCSMLRSEVRHGSQERQRVMLSLFRDLGWKDLADLTLAEVGCSTGGILLDFLRFSLSAQNMCGIELLPELVTAARRSLPALLAAYEADAISADIAPKSQDVWCFRFCWMMVFNALLSVACGSGSSRGERCFGMISSTTTQKIPILEAYE